MAYVFIALQLLASLVVRLLFHRRACRWTIRHTLLCTDVPLFLFLLWGLLWWEQILPADLLPSTWLDKRPSVGERAFICLPPLFVSWLLFFILRGRGRAHEAVA
jgi:hypothetical protein